MLFMHAVAKEGVQTHIQESALTVDSGRKIPCLTGELTLPQWRAGPTLYQLSYIPPPPHFAVTGVCKKMNREEYICPGALSFPNITLECYNAGSIKEYKN